jgi:hypothetical protein
MAKVSNEQFVMEFEDFIDMAQSNKDELNFSSADQTEGTALKTGLAAKLNTMQAARAAFDAAEADFNGTRRTASAFQSSRKKFFGSNPAVSDATKASLNIVKSTSGSAGAVNQPLNLSAEGFSSGVNTLKWERNGNPSYRNFTVEYRVGENGQWLIAGTTRKTVFNHKNQTPGTKIYYRVYAHTDDEQSPHSNTAVVYA